MQEWTPLNIALLITAGIFGAVIIIIITYVGRKLSMIEAHVNSAETGYKAKIEALQDENRLLRESAAEKKEIASVLAQVIAIKETTKVGL